MYPEIAFKNFIKNKSKVRHRKLVERVLKQLSLFKNIFLKVNFIHQAIDAHLVSVLNDPLTKRLISCTQGCSACCHTQVSITEDEGEFLARKIINEKIKINWHRLLIQAKAQNDPKLFLKIPFALRQCIFLDQSGSCQVYSDRPSVCRTNYVISHPDSCRTIDGVEQPIRLVKTELADSIVIAAFSKSKENGTLANVISKFLKNL